MQGRDESSLPAFVVSLNLHRRHLNETQRGAVAAKIANMKSGGDRRSDGFKPSIDGLKPITAAQAAENAHA